MPQRFKLYDAEDTLGFGGFFPGVEYAQIYLDKMVRTKWWRQHSTVRYVKANYPANGMTGSFKIDDLHGEIGFGIARLCEHSCVHEMTHFLTGVPLTKDTTPEAHEKDHGPKFAGALLAMYKRFIGAKTSEALAKEFDRVGVKYIEYE